MPLVPGSSSRPRCPTSRYPTRTSRSTYSASSPSTPSIRARATVDRYTMSCYAAARNGWRGWSYGWTTFTPPGHTCRGAGGRSRLTSRSRTRRSCTSWCARYRCSDRGSPGQGIDPAQGVGEPVRAGHAAYEVGRVLCRDPGGRDVKGLGRTATVYFDRVGGTPERRLGDADHRYAELRVRMRAKPRSPVRVEVHVPVNDEQVDPARTAQHRPHGRQFAGGERAGLVRRHLGERGGVLGEHGREGRLRRDHQGRRGTTGRRVVDIDRTV